MNSPFFLDKSYTMIEKSKCVTFSIVFICKISVLCVKFVQQKTVT